MFRSKWKEQMQEANFNTQIVSMVCQFLLPYCIAGTRPTTDDVAEAMLRIEYDDARSRFSQVLALTMMRADELVARRPER